MIKKAFFFLFLAVHFSFQNADVHKFYLSVTDVNYSAKDQALQLVTRIFVDDFQRLLNERYDKSVVLSREVTQEKTDAYIEDYFNKKMLFKIKNQSVQLNFIGKRYEDDLIICYLEAPKISDFSEVKVTNEILMELFEDQKNIVHFKKKDQEKSLLLLKDNETQTINFN
ncbi:DUF6702 family protein [Mesonia sp. K7]|uniref:DUF6702 family protein n=1 Tax=Mesonia sp. K7 TaxID=2218606 RepID=UPI000DAA4457|nr:DUF6702 family protein [Mesonia sp. K7]PZD79678.1 hypothetical protein DNG35_01350 [Mesonia sp. K7]